MDPRVLERGLDMIEEVLGLEHLRMTPVEPAEQAFPGPTRPNADLPEGRLEGCVVPKATLAERLLDGVVKVVALELRDPPGAVAPHARQPQDIPFAQAGADEHGDESHEGQILLPHVLVERWARQSECDVDAFEHRERNVDLVAQLSKGLVRTRWTSAPDLDVPEGQIP